MTLSGRTLQRLAPVICILGVIFVVYINYGVILQHLSREAPLEKDLAEGQSVLAGLDLDSAVHWHHLQVADHTNATVRETKEKDSSEGIQQQQQQTKRPAGLHYAVYGCTSPANKDYNYVFYLPLTALAWEHLGFHSIVLLTGSRLQWSSQPALALVLKKLQERNATVIHLESLPANEVMLSQVSRLFVSGFYNFTDSDYLVTTDADLWPLEKSYLLLEPGKQILSTNAHCCGDFVHEGVKYDMIPMGSVGATIGTWRDVMSNDGETPLPNDVEGILQYLERDFGRSTVRGAVQKGENVGWYLDQRTISIRAGQWATKHGLDKVQYHTRKVGRDRIDRSGWSTSDMDGKIDAHLLQNGYKSSEWLKLRELLLHMYGGGSPQYIWCEEYRAAFLRAAGS